MNTRLLTLAASPIVILSSLTLAQTQDVTPYYAVVQSEKISIRCGEGDNRYVVAQVASGSLVRVDGESQNWSRIAYPAGATAFVRVEDVEAATETVKLTKANRLRAASMTTGWAGSWQALLPSPLASGTTLKLVEPIKENDVLVGYRVAAPDNARGFVESRHLRRATEAEAARAGVTPTPATPAPTTTPTPTTPTPTPAAGTDTATTPTPAAGTQPEAPKPTDLTQPPVAPKAGDTPTQPADLTIPTLEQKTAAPGEASTPTTTPKLATENVPVQPEQRRVGTIDQLEQSFQAVWKQPALSAEFDELIVEIDRAMNNESDEFRRRALKQRRDALELRREFRETLRRQDEDKAKLDSTRIRLAQQLEDLERNRYYTIIGQLQPSTVYDGSRLPQMYRVVSVGGTAPRTLGYLRRSDKFDLDKMLGLVVGVIGDAQLDRSLQLNIITPVHVDLLRSNPGGTLQAPQPVAPMNPAPAATPTTTPTTPATDAATGEIDRTK